MSKPVAVSEAPTQGPRDEAAVVASQMEGLKLSKKGRAKRAPRNGWSLGTLVESVTHIIEQGKPEGLKASVLYTRFSRKHGTLAAAVATLFPQNTPKVEDFILQHVPDIVILPDTSVGLRRAGWGSVFFGDTEAGEQGRSDEKRSESQVSTEQLKEWTVERLSASLLKLLELNVPKGIHMSCLLAEFASDFGVGVSIILSHLFPNNQPKAAHFVEEYVPNVVVQRDNRVGLRLPGWANMFLNAKADPSSEAKEEKAMASKNEVAIASKRGKDAKHSKAADDDTAWTIEMLVSVLTPIIEESKPVGMLCSTIGTIFASTTGSVLKNAIGAAFHNHPRGAPKLLNFVQQYIPNGRVFRDTFVGLALPGWNDQFLLPESSNIDNKQEKKSSQAKAPLAPTANTMNATTTTLNTHTTKANKQPLVTVKTVPPKNPTASTGTAASGTPSKRTNVSDTKKGKAAATADAHMTTPPRPTVPASTARRRDGGSVAPPPPHYTQIINEEVAAAFFNSPEITYSPPRPEALQWAERIASQYENIEPTKPAVKVVDTPKRKQVANGHELLQLLTDIIGSKPYVLVKDIEREFTKRTGEFPTKAITRTKIGSRGALLKFLYRQTHLFDINTKEHVSLFCGSAPTCRQQENPELIAKINQQIVEFMGQVHPAKAAEDQWRQLENTVRTCIAKCLPTASLSLFGSAAAGLLTRASDLDFGVDAHNYKGDHVSLLTAIRKELYRCRLKGLSIESVLHARVPVLKLTWSLAKCDISVANGCSLLKADLLKRYIGLDERVRPILLFMKSWGKQRCINNPQFGTLNSFSLVLMTIHALQVAVNPPVLPCLQQGFQPPVLPPPVDFRPAWMPLLPLEEAPKYYQVAASFQSANNLSVAELLIEIFHYFASRIDFKRECISVRLGRTIPVKKDHFYSPYEPFIAVEDPFDPTDNVARTITKDTFPLVHREFKRAHRQLCSPLADTSVLCAPYRGY